MNYALFFKNLSFYNEFYTVRLGAILRPFWHRAGPAAEQSRAEPSRTGTGRAEPSRAGPGRAEPSRADPGRAGPSRAGPGRDGPRRPRESNFSRPGRCNEIPKVLLGRSHIFFDGAFRDRKQARKVFKKLPGGGTLHSDRIWARGEPRGPISL